MRLQPRTYSRRLKPLRQFAEAESVLLDCKVCFHYDKAPVGGLAGNEIYKASPCLLESEYAGYLSDRVVKENSLESFMVELQGVEQRPKTVADRAGRQSQHRSANYDTGQLFKAEEWILSLANHAGLPKNTPLVFALKQFIKNVNLPDQLSTKTYNLFALMLLSSPPFHQGSKL